MTERDKFINELKSKYSNDLTSNGSNSQRDEFINSLKSKYQPTQEKVSQPSSLSVDDVKSKQQEFTLSTGQKINALPVEDYLKTQEHYENAKEQEQLDLLNKQKEETIKQEIQKVLSDARNKQPYEATLPTGEKVMAQPLGNTLDAEKFALLKYAQETNTPIKNKYLDDEFAQKYNDYEKAKWDEILYGNTSTGKALLDSLATGYLNRFASTANIGLQPLSKLVGKDLTIDSEMLTKDSQKRLQNWVGDSKTKKVISDSVSGASGMVADVLAGLALGNITGINPNVAQGAIMGSGFTNDKAMELEEQGENYWGALLKNAPSGMIQAKLEQILPEAELFNYTGGNLLKFIGQKFGGEFLEEFLQNISEDTYDKFFNQKLDNAQKTVGQIGTDALYSGLIGGIIGGTGASVGVALGKPAYDANVRNQLSENATQSGITSGNDSNIVNTTQNVLNGQTALERLANELALESQNKTLSNQTQQNVSTEAENQAIMSNMKNVNAKFNEVETLSQNYGENGAKQFINSYNQEKDPVNYNRAFQTAYISGRYGQDLNEQIKRYPFIADELDSETLMKAYESGINDAKIEEEITSRNLNNKNTGLIENEYTKNMNPKLKNNINSLGKIVGMPIELYFEENSDVNGEFKGDKIRLNVNGTKPLLYTLGHEIGHQLKLTDRKAYRELQNAIITNILNNNAYGFETAFADLKTRYDEKMAEVERGNLNYDEVMEEITSDAIGQILDNETTINQLVNENPTLWQKVKDIFEEILNKIRNLYGKGYSEYRYDSSNGYMSNLLDPTQLEDAISKLDKALKSTQEKLGTKSESSTETKYSSAGINAKTADKLKLETAKNLYKNGMSQQTIFEQTGWYKGADNKWKFEISTKDVAFYNPYRFFDSVEFGENKELAERTVYKLPELMKYDALYKAYPFLKKVNIRFFKGDARHGGYVDSDGKYDIFLNSKIFSWDYREENYQYGDMYQGKGWGETLLHEVQHLIQHKEGFLPGSNMNHFLDKVTDEELSRAVKEEGIEENENIPDDAVEDMIEGIRRRLAFEKYQNTAGEAEAREVGTRFDSNKRGFDIDKRVPYTNVENKGKFEKYTKEKGKYKYSLTEDSQGNKLSKEQQEFFKDSKVRDEEGKLQVVYHGSKNKGFNVFNYNANNQTGTDYGKAFYFTSDYQKAQGYSYDVTKDSNFQKNENEKQKIIKEIAKNGVSDELKQKYKQFSDKSWNIMQNENYKNNDINAFGEIKEIYLNLKNPLIVDANGKYYYEVYDDYFKQAKQNNNDGIIVKNVVDNPRGKARPIDVYIAFNSNQIKNIDNTNPTESADIRYSLSENIQVEKPKKELTSEQKIAKLEKQVNKLKQQTQLTKGLVKDDKAIREYARELIEANGSEANSNKVYNDLKELYSMQSEVLKGKASKEQLLNISNKSSEIVDEILSKSYLTSDVEETYSVVAKRLRNTPIKVSEELKNSISDYNEFRKQNFGKLRLKNDEGMGIDSVYQELSQDYPWLFPEDIVSAEDRLYVISEFVNNKPKSIAVSDMTDYEQIREDLSSEIFNSYNDMKSIETYADKIKTYYEEKLDNTKLLQQWINALDKKSMQDKMALQKKQYQEKIKEIKYTDKERQDMKLLEQKIKQSERIKSVYDKKLIQAEKKKIQRNVKELDTMLRKPTITKHIPQELRTSVADFLANIDFTTDKQKAQKVMQIKALKQIYQNIAQTSEFGANSDITTQILTLAEDLEGKRVVDMNREEIQLLSTLVKNVKHTVSNTNKVFIDGKYQDTSVKAKELLNDLVKKNTNTDNKTIYGLKNTFELGELKPITFFRKLGNSFVSNIYNDLRQGQNKNVDNITKIQDYLKNVIPNDMKAEIGNAKPTTYQLSNGIIDLTKQQLMSLYLLNKREQAQGHIYGLGIIQGATKYKDGLKDITINEKDIALKVTEEDVNKLLSNLSEREKKIADDISIFLNTTAKEFVNEASMKLYGFEIANEEDYFPIQTKKSFFDDSFDTYTADPTITSWSALKQTKENSSSPIVINNIFDVVSSHLSKSSVYNSFAVPMDNIKRLMNYRDANGNRIIEAEMNRAYGKGAYDYIKKLMADLQGGVKYEGGVEFLDTVVKNTKVARLGLNLRVAVQQVSAYPRALAVLDESDMLKALAKNTRSWNEVLDKSQTARWKEWGYYNADVGRSMENLIFDKHDLTDLYFYLPQRADSKTWHRLYSATEYNIRKNHPNVEVGSDEYFKLVNDKFDEVIDRTQVIDTTLNRSQNMRKKDTTWKITTAFRSEPTVSENLILDSYYQYQNAKTPSEKKKALNTVRKNVEGYAGGLIFSVLIQAIYDSLKKPQDDDEDNFLNKLLENLISEMAGQVYFGKEIYNFTQGYSSSNLQYGAIEKLFKTGTKVVEHTGSIIEGKESSYTNIGLLKDIITSASEVAGIPAGNVIKGVENSVNNIANATKNTYVEYEGLKLTKNIKYESNRKYFYDKLFKAYMNGTKSGDMEEAIKIYNDMLANGFKEDSINNSITSRLTKKVQLEPEMEKLVDEYAKNGQTEKFTTLVQDLTNKGYSIETIEKGYLKYTKQEAEAKIYTPKEIYKEFKKGNIEKANEMYESSIEAGSDVVSMNKALELLQNNK